MVLIAAVFLKQLELAIIDFGVDDVRIVTIYTGFEWHRLRSHNPMTKHCVKIDEIVRTRFPMISKPGLLKAMNMLYGVQGMRYFEMGVAEYKRLGEIYVSGVEISEVTIKMLALISRLNDSNIKTNKIKEIIQRIVNEWNGVVID